MPTIQYTNRFVIVYKKWENSGERESKISANVWEKRFNWTKLDVQTVHLKPHKFINIVTRYRNDSLTSITNDSFT